eukprot:1142088-Pelagomonas_calceolata.AAC.2
MNRSTGTRPAQVSAARVSAMGACKKDRSMSRVCCVAAGDVRRWIRAPMVLKGAGGDGCDGVGGLVVQGGVAGVFVDCWGPAGTHSEGGEH